MTQKKTIIFHDIDHARAALAIAHERGAEIVLRTAPGAAAYAGVGYLWAVIAQTGADKADIEAVIDCGEDAGTVLAALRTGWKLVKFSGPGDVFAKLADIAAQQGATLLEPDSDSAVLDLLDTPDPLAACRDFLGSDQK